MRHHVTLIPGDGIGEEVAEATLEVLKAAGVDIQWDHQSAGLAALYKSGTPVPKATLDSIRKNGVALKGPTTTPVASGHRSANVILRQELDLYACIRPVKSVPGVKSRYENVDLVIFRENTEGLYGGQELEVTKGTFVALKVVTEHACTAIANATFAYAAKHNRHHVTVGHKANILKLSDGLFLHRAYQVAEQYPGITCNDVIVDALCMRLVTDPSQFDMLLLENLYGDILSDLCAGLVGGLGLVPGANIGNDYAVFEAVHGSAPDIAGQGLANPTALIKSAVMMLQHLGEQTAAARIDTAVESVFLQGHVRTRDLGGQATTQEFTKALLAAL